MNIKKFGRLVTGLFFVMLSSVSFAITVTGSGSTFVINKIAGFDGVDGAAREAAFVAAAQFWADKLVSPVEIVIDAQFSSSLYCTTNNATLGSAGPLSTYFSSGATSFGLQDNVWYPTALINAHYGADYFAGNADIDATFNADIGDPDCLASSGWYYGLDGNVPAGEIDFYEVVMHELGHGLGILSLVNTDGSNNSGVIDIFTTFLYDQSTTKAWSAMNNTERSISVVNDSNLVWNGANVNALVGDLTAGVNAGKVQMYAPNPYEGGSSISHFDTDLTPNELMEPQYTGGATNDHSTALLKDIGWTIYAASNAVPNITGQGALSVDEDNSLLLTLSDLAVTDSDNSYPADFTLTVSSGSNYSVSGDTITPAANFNGTLTVPVAVNDGTNDSASYNLNVTVNSVNDEPQIVGQSSLQINEDSSLVLTSAELTITDPDDSSFTLSIGAGANYSVSGTTITPSVNFNGTLTVPVTVNDGEADSGSFDVSVTVNAMNDVPLITSTPSVSIDEDNTYEFLLSDFGVSDVDSSSFVLDILPGTYYSDSGNVITPDVNFNGTLSVNARVYDGNDYSSSVSFSMTVTAVNDIPQITGQTTLSTDEDSSLVLTTADLTITDPDDSSFTLTIGAGTNYSLSGNTITPDVDYNGTLTVPVTVNDGETDSGSFNVSVTVNAMNDAPVITSTPSVSIDEDTNHSFAVTDFSIDDIDSSNFTLELLAGANYTLSGNNLTPNANFNGNLTVNVRVSDGIANSDTRQFSVNVTPVNDAPTIVGQQALSVNEDESITLAVASLTIVDIDSTDFNLTVQSGANYTVTGNTVTPAAEFSGSLTVPVTVTDGTLASASYDVNILVNVINDQPIISVLPSLIVAEDSSLVIDLAEFTIVDADSSSFTLQVFAGLNYTLTGNTISPTANFNGQLLVPVRVFDGLQYSPTVNLTIDVTPVNDLPILSGSPNESVLYTDTYNAPFTASDADNSTLSFSVSSAHGWLSIDSNGVLSGSPTASEIGTHAVTVSVTDGLASDSISFDLNVSDHSNTDMTVALSSDAHLMLINEVSNLIIHVENFGPAASIDGAVSVEIPSGMAISNLDSRCVFNGTDSIECPFAALTSSDDFLFSASQATAQINSLVATVRSSKTEVNDNDNQTDVTLVFATNIDSPVVPISFAQGMTTNAAALRSTSTGSEIWLANDLSHAEQRLKWSEDYLSTSLLNEFSVNQETNDLLIADFDNDGLDDVVFANNGSNDIYLQRDSGFPLDASLGSNTSYAVAAADFNDDGFLDLVFANDGTNQIYLNNQVGQFSLAQSIGNANSKAVAIIDANSDGWPDVLFANTDDDDLLYLNNGADQSLGIFNTTAVLTSIEQHSTQTVVASSLDADGINNDVIFGYTTLAGGLSLQISEVINNAFSSRQQLDVGDVLAISVGDYDGDASNDIAVLNADGIVQVYSRTSAIYELIEVFAVDQASNIVLSPLNSDAKADLIVTTSGLVASQLFLSELPQPAVPDMTQNGDSAEVQETTTIIITEPQTEQTQTTIIVQGGSTGGILCIFGVLFIVLRRRQPH